MVGVTIGMCLLFFRNLKRAGAWSNLCPLLGTIGALVPLEGILLVPLVVIAFMGVIRVRRISTMVFIMVVVETLET